MHPKHTTAPHKPCLFPQEGYFFTIKTNDVTHYQIELMAAQRKRQLAQGAWDLAKTLIATAIVFLLNMFLN